VSDTSRAVSAFFRTAVKRDVDGLEENLLLSERQKNIYRMYYLEKHDICFVADTVGCCERVVKKELRTIRRKIISEMDL